MNNYGFVSKIQHFSTDDGDGIRTTVFMQGCRLKCKWCHNPETLAKGGSLLVFDRRCTLCGICESVCPEGAHRIDKRHIFLKEKCRLCGKCAHLCPNKAIEQSGRTVTADEVLDEILEDADFYGENGGVTISGGEPLLQADFAAEIAQKCCENGIGVYIDTAASLPFSRFEKLIKSTKKFLVDFKAAEPRQMKSETGADFDTVLANIKLLAEKSSVLLRIPVIPGYNDSAEVMKKAGEYICGLDAQLLPFHRLGAPKYEAMRLDYKYADCKAPSVEKMNELKKVLKSKGVNVI